MKDNERYVGFWPWPRSWCTEAAAELAEQLPKDQYSCLTKSLTVEQEKILNTIATSYSCSSFTAQLCADGLLAYRHTQHEAAIDLETAKHSCDDEESIVYGHPASAAAWNHYLGALNIIFLLIQSELQRRHGCDFHWIEPVSRPMIVRYRYDGSQNAKVAFYGPSTELGILRRGGTLALGARIDGGFQAQIVKSFDSAMPTFVAAHKNPSIWSFLYRYSAAWTAHASGHFDACVMLAWSLLERDLVRQVKGLLLTILKGQVNTTDASGVTKKLPDETKVRAQIENGESPMAGKLIGILTAHGLAPNQYLLTAKAARDQLLHGGSPAALSDSSSALSACNDIATAAYGVHLGPRLTLNAHLALT